MYVYIYIYSNNSNNHDNDNSSDNNDDNNDDIYIVHMGNRRVRRRHLRQESEGTKGGLTKRGFALLCFSPDQC